MAKAGVYLEVYDMFLYSCKYGIDLQIVYNLSDFQSMTTTSTIKMVEDFVGIPCPMQDAKMTKHTVLLSAAHLGAVEAVDDRLGLNHWLPCWRVDEADETVIQAEFKRLQEQCEKAKGKLNSALSRLLKSASEDDDDETIGIMKETFAHNVKLEDLYLENARELLDRLHTSFGLGMRDVAKDGNCGIWSLWALQVGSPFGATDSHDQFFERVQRPDSDMQKEMRSMRQDLKQMWESVADNEWWQLCFRHLAGWERNLAPQKEHKVDAPSTPKKNPSHLTAAQMVAKLKSEHSPTKLSGTSRRCGKAGLVAPKPVTGPSVPMVRKAEKVSDPVTHVKVEEIEKARLKRQGPEVKEEENEEDVVALAQPQRKKRQRQSQHQKEMKFARQYLAERGLTHPDFVKIHSKKALLRGAVDCKVGGWAELVALLVRGSGPVECTKCQGLLQSRPSFSVPSLTEALEHFREANAFVNPPVNAGETEAAGEKPAAEGQHVQGQDGNADVIEAEDGLDGDDVEEDGDDGEGEAAVKKLLADNPCLEVLEEGSGMKRIPVKCHLCFRKASKRHPVFDPRVY